MKNSLLSVMLSCFVLFLTGCESSQSRSVREVMEELNIYETNLMNSFQQSNEQIESRPDSFAGLYQTIGDLGHAKQLLLQFSDNISSINVSRCPPDFRAAYNDYISSALTVTETIDKATSIDNPWETTKAWFFLGTSGEQLGNQLDQTRQNLSVIAASYGVRED